MGSHPVRRMVGLRNRKALENPVGNLIYYNKPLRQMTNEEIKYSLTRFVTEVRKTDRSDYPGLLNTETVRDEWADNLIAKLP